MKMIYAVSSGYYSDYKVHVVCENKLIANSIAAKIKKIWNYAEAVRVENIPMVESEDDAITRTEYSVEIDLSGNEVNRSERDCLLWEVREELPSSGPIYFNKSKKGAWATSYRGYDVALKAARDKLGRQRMRD